MGREQQVEGQLEPAPGGMDEQVYSGSREMLSLVELGAQEVEVKETMVWGRRCIISLC